jgi:NTE family protein
MEVKMSGRSPIRAILVAVTALSHGIATPLLHAGEAGNPPRPRVGLVLAGGGAKGGAHVGVLKVLEQLHVPIDCIAGTSMGALIGGGYASGISADGLEAFVLDVDWKKVVGRQGSRDLQPIEQKRAGVTYSNDIELGITPDGITTPDGLVNTGNVEDLLRSYVATARLETNFDRLPIPYRAVATDMVSGKIIVLGEGDLATAMRASMAIPGAFAPVIIGDTILSDGGLVRNIPIDVARDLCADTVIVVNLIEPPADPGKLKSAMQIFGRTMDVMIAANETLQLQTLRADDILINVEMGSIGTADFERIPETLPLGVAAAQAMAPALARLAVTEPEYLAWRQSVTSSQQIETRVADVQYEGLKRVNPAYLEQIDRIEAGEVVDTATISQEAQRMAVLQDFDSVSYRLDGDPQSPTLTWLPHEKNWGPDFLKIDIGAYASLDGDLNFILYGRHTRTWVNSLGAEWRNELALGSTVLLATSLFQPLDAAHRFFVEPQARFSRSTEDVFVDGERIARYNLTDAGGLVDFGMNMGRHAQVRAGYVYSNREVEVDVGSTLMPETDTVDAGLRVSMDYDSRDTAFRPTQGFAAALEYLSSDTSLGAERQWQRAEIGVGMAVPLRRDVIWVTAAGGSNLGTTLPPDRAFAIGGPSSFPGLELGELRSDEYWTLGTNYLWRVKDVLPIKNLALYAGVGLMGGAVYDRIDGGGSDEIYGGSIFFTGRTQIGPLTIGVATTSVDSWSLWLSVGRPTGHGTILERGIFR